MLKELHIQDIILIEKAQVTFETGLHIFSGETGAGKTAILQALRLLLGVKADTQVIRKGAEKATVWACFELDNAPIVSSILSQSGITIDTEDDLLIKREITSTGKSRVYINSQMTQVGVLKHIAPFLMEVVAQHASQKLLDADYHRELLDTFGTHLPLTQSVMESFFHLSSLKEELEELLEKEKNEKALKKEWQETFDEIDQAQIQSYDEDESLFSEYEKLSSTQELHDALSQNYHSISESDTSILLLLKRGYSSLERIKISSPEFKAIQDNLLSSIENLNELSYEMLHFRDNLEDNPQKLSEIDDRLKLLRSLCKRYGPTLQDVLNKKEKLSLQLTQIEELSDVQASLKSQIEVEEKKFLSLCNELSDKRKAAKLLLEKKIATLLADLNLPNAKLIIELAPSHPTSFGQEKVEFFLQANVGEKKAALKDQVSGGELSRLLLALKVILSDLEEIPTLFFDEVDANLGGETAPKIGKLLKKMSQKKQIIVITHLPQVAAFADHHYQICKKEQKERTFSLIEKLSQKQKQKEIERMLGGTTLSGKASELATDLLQSSKS